MVTVRYPFHPLVGQSVLVVGSTEHGNACHLIIRKPDDGAKSLLPEWMTSPEAGTIRIVSCPHLSVNRLLDVRTVVDGLMASFGKQVRGGCNNETMDPGSTRSVQDTSAERTTTTSTSNSIRSAKSASQRSDVCHRRKKSKRQPGGRR